MTGHAWVRSSTTLIAWPVAPGARGAPTVRGLPSSTSASDADDDGDGEVVLLVSALSLCRCSSLGERAQEIVERRRSSSVSSKRGRADDEPKRKKEASEKKQWSRSIPIRLFSLNRSTSKAPAHV